MEDLVVGFAVLLLVFLVCRELVCWYWKINEITAALKKQEDNQQALIKSLHDINGNLIRIAVLLTPDVAQLPED